MTRQDALQEFKKILTPYTPDKEKLTHLTEDTHLLRDLQINSANLVDIIIDTETAYNINISNDAVEQMATVGDCLDVILKD
jgi:acyl carrier protein